MKLKTFKSIKDLEKEIEAYEKITQKKEDKPENYPLHIVYNKVLEDNDILPGSNRNSSSKEKFNSHKIYKTLVNDLNYPKGPEIKNKVDTWYKDPLYGRVNTKNNLIYHNYWIFQNISGNPSKEICVFDFVADAFEFMKTIFASKKPSTQSQFLLELSAKAGNTSTIAPEDKYNSHIDGKFQQFLQEGGKQLENTKQIKNFNDFKNTFINYLKGTQSTITYAGYFDTLNIDIYDSYLAFDVFDDGGSPTDDQKVDFLNDPNYFIYEYAARQAGFFVDQNKPWRLVANMKSKAMVVAMRRRLIVTEALLKTKDSIVKSENFLNGLSGEESVIDLQYILDFVDYFRKEISFNDSKVADYKNTLLSYISRKYDVINDTNSKNLTGTLKLKDLNIDEADENKLTRALTDILLVIEDNKPVVNFIFRSLENQQKVLSFIDKKFSTIKPSDTYKAAFSPVSDYTYFTYFPIKLQNYYEEFITKNPTYNIFGKTERGATKVFKNDREPLDLTEYKISDNLINNFYNFEVMVDYVDIRLYEESRQYSKSARDSIINEVKEVYLRAVEDYKAGKDYVEMRNISTKLIEAYTGFGYQKLKPIDLIAEAKKAPLYAENAYFEKSFFEPQIQLPRICLTLPARADILIEEDVCGKFDVSPDIVEEEIFGVSGSACFDINDCNTGLYCKGSDPSVGIQGKCTSLKTLQQEKPTGLFSKTTGKCDVANTLQNFVALFAGTPNSGLVVLVVGSFIKKAAENAKTKSQCDNLVPLLLEVVPEDTKAVISQSLKDKNISGIFKD
tara:strand:+ start:2293 stop:4653 length:2361 start_codon:yes stop_codon:yes gene_type:complete